MFITIGLLSSLLWFYMFPLIHQWFIQSLIITIDILSSHISFYRFPSMQQWFWFRLNFLLFCAFLICSIFVLFLNSWLASFQISFEVGFASEFMAVGARRVFFTILLARMFFFSIWLWRLAFELYVPLQKVHNSFFCFVTLAFQKSISVCFCWISAACCWIVAVCCMIFCLSVWISSLLFGSTLMM